MRARTVAAVALVASAMWCVSVIRDSIEYKFLIQAVESPVSEDWLVLMGDSAGFGDLSWHVYEIPRSTDPEDVRIQRGFGEGALFENYSEAGHHTASPKISIVGGRYLVFDRGGLHHSLYDLERREIIVNEGSPWNAFRDSSYYRALEEKPTLEQETPHVDTWKRSILHDPIERLIRELERRDAV